MKIKIRTKNKKEKHKQIKELNEIGSKFFNFIGVIRNFQILFASLIKFSIAVVFEVWLIHKKEKKKKEKKKKEKKEKRSSKTKQKC